LDTAHIAFVNACTTFASRPHPFRYSVGPIEEAATYHVVAMRMTLDSLAEGSTGAQFLASALGLLQEADGSRVDTLNNTLGREVLEKVPIAVHIISSEDSDGDGGNDEGDLKEIDEENEEELAQFKTETVLELSAFHKDNLEKDTVQFLKALQESHPPTRVDRLLALRYQTGDIGKVVLKNAVDVSKIAAGTAIGMYLAGRALRRDNPS
jgi:hypothetical protein